MIAMPDECFNDYVVRMLEYLCGDACPPTLVFGTTGTAVSTTQSAEKQVDTPNQWHTLVVTSDAANAKTVIKLNDSDAFVVPAGGPWLLDFRPVQDKTRISVRASAIESNKNIWVTVI